MGDGLGKVGTLIQARMNSSRLPEKVLLPLAGRPMLGRVLDRHRLMRHGGTLVVVTSDNPRTEDPQRIVDDILQGIAQPGHVDVDREQAIRWAVARAVAGDAVLVAGKGHETTQDVGGVRHAFDDRAVLRRALETP